MSATPKGRRITRKKLMKVLNRNLQEAGVELTVRRFNTILTDLGFRLGAYRGRPKK